MWNTWMLVADSLVIRNSYLLFLGGQQIKFQGPSFQYIEGDSNSLWAKSIDCKKWEEYFCIFLNFYRSLLRSLWPPWSKTNNNQPVETLEVKWQQILLLWRLPTCSFKTLLRKLHNQISLKELFKHKVNGLTRSAKSQQLCFHRTAELSSCIGPFLNLWLLLQLCPGSAGEEHVCLCPAGVLAFAWVDLLLDKWNILNSLQLPSKAAFLQNAGGFWLSDLPSGAAIAQCQGYDVWFSRGVDHELLSQAEQIRLYCFSFTSAWLAWLE